MEIRFELFRIGLFDFVPVRRRFLEKVHPAHRPHAADRHVQTVLACQLHKAIVQHRADRLQLFEVAVVFQHFQAGDSGRHRQWVSRKRSSLIHRSHGSDQIHDIATTAVGSNR